MWLPTILQRLNTNDRLGELLQTDKPRGKWGEDKQLFPILNPQTMLNVNYLKPLPEEDNR